MSFNLQHLENEIIDQYLYDENKSRPWIIGFRGGKDSTMLLQVVWNTQIGSSPLGSGYPLQTFCSELKFH